MPTPRKVAVLLFDGVNAIDVTGPAEAFAIARADGTNAGYALAFWSLSGQPVATESGLRLMPDSRPPPAPRGDVLIIPGGAGIRNPGTLDALACWLKAHQEKFARVVSVCTGAYALAEAGVLDGRRVATHWAHADQLAARYPELTVDADALYLRDGRFHTSGGVTAGIDLALDLIRVDFGHATAAAVARELVVFLRRSGKQAQFSQPLRLMARAPDRLAETCLWAANHLDADLSVEALARRAHLSSRQFARRFRAAFGEAPATHVRRLRVDAARTLLEQGVSVQQAAPTVGFASVDGLRRAFEAVFGLTPREYQRRFETRESLRDRN